ncbi:MAG: hypothetical protein U0172_05835 [Nitrospiraceae bacterium]
MARTHSRVMVSGFLGLLGLVSLSACASEQGAMQSGGGSSSTPAAVSAGKGGATAAMADSLAACLARIPKDSTDGARMVAEQTCRSNDAYTQTISGMATSKSGDRASAGTQGDSMEACMARIPSNATAGQRLLAESSCQRDTTTHR